MTGSDHAVRALRDLGGAAPRATVLAAVAQRLGRREAGCAIALAVLARRIEEVLMPSGRIGLQLTADAPACTPIHDHEDPMSEDDPMTEQELGAYVAARFRQLLRIGLRDGCAAMAEKARQLNDEDRELLLLTALGHLVDSTRRATTAHHN